jgi:hypothetical protein
VPPDGGTPRSPITASEEPGRGGQASLAEDLRLGPRLCRGMAQAAIRGIGILITDLTN